ncbi:MAG TPA: efflux RND transporter permease subunit [Galbitalea sp.]|jgi:HAE1 family hydrophobic/amphiphilic exporter-1|nr:efflux RND transporter permease subunit [Galbitalea sp.]
MHLLSVFSLRNRALIALITIVIAVFGGIALTSLKQELIPSIQLPSVYVVTSDPGASPAVVSHDVSTPIENALQGIENLDSTTATSNTNSSTVTASFTYGSDITAYEEKVQVAVDRISSTLPDGVTPQVITFSTTDLPIISLAITSDLDKHVLASKLSTLTLTNLKQLDGVSNVSLLGAVTQRITITPNATTLADDGLTLQSIKTALQTNGTLLGSGSITENGKTLTVQSGTKVGSLSGLAALPLVGTTSTTVPTGFPGRTTTVTTPKVFVLSDVATVARVDDPVTGYSRVNGKPAVTVSITKTADGNTVAVSKEVRDDISTLEKQLGHNTRFTVVSDQAPSITTSIDSLAEEGLLGLAFAVVIIFIFLFSIRSTVVAAISIPISVLITFIGMLASGYTLNVITLAGLTIAIGRVVDDSIVVIENIKRHIGLGEEKLQAILTAVREVAVAVTASTITTVAVFLPIALVSGLTGELFRPFALTVTIALAASLFVALTIVPVLAYWFIKSPNDIRVHQPVSARVAIAGIAVAAVLLAAAIVVFAIEVLGRYNAGDARLFIGTLPIGIVSVALLVILIVLIVVYRRIHFPKLPPSVAHVARPATVDSSADELDKPTRLQRVYLPVIRWTLRFPALVLVLAIVVLGGSALLAKTSLTTNFIGNSGQNTLTVTQTLDKSASLAAQDAASKRVETSLRGVKGVTTVEVSIGSGGNSLRAAFAGGGSTTYNVTTSSKADQDKLLTTITKKMKAIKDDGDIEVSAASSGLTSSNIEIDVTAGSDADLRRASTALITKAKKIPGVSSVTSNLSASLPYIAVQIDRQKAAKDGLTELAVGSAVAQAMNPGSSGSIVIGDTTFDIYIEDTSAPKTQAALKAFSIRTATGSKVPLSDLATIKTVKGPSSITTIKGLRSATIEVVPGTANVGNLSAEVQTAVDKTTIPGSATATLGGFTSQQGDAFSQLGLALLAAILIVYVVMVAAFKSLRQPLLLLVSIPFAATGAIVLQVASGVPLGVASLIGVLMLVGIVVTNAIVLVDLINQYRTRGMKVGDAIVHGASRRLRPILMTALATIFALLPLGLGLSGHGSFISQPLAIVVIGGLVSSTLLTLIVLPVLYYLVEGAKERREERRLAQADVPPQSVSA